MGTEMKKDKDKNYLDFIPVIKQGLRWEAGEDGAVVIIRENKGVTSRIASFLYGAPKETKVSLDEYGNFIWKHIDGKCSVYDIAGKVKEQYGNDAEPLYERLCQYFRALTANGFVEMSERQQ